MSCIAACHASQPPGACEAHPAFAGAAVLAGMLAFAPGPLTADLALRPAAAASVPMSPTRAQCAAAWNLPANAQWHIYASHLGSVRANVGAMAAIDAKSGALVARGCHVTLWLTRRAGH